jgi:hypothetical protein
LQQLKLHTFLKRRYHLNELFFKSTLVLNSVLFWELLVLLFISETFLCSMTAFQIKFVLLLDAL